MKIQPKTNMPNSSTRFEIIRAKVYTPVRDQTLVRGTTPAFVYHEDGGIVINRDCGLFEAVGPWDDIRGKYQGRVFDHRPFYVFPGLVDCHVHLPQYNVSHRGTMELLPWLDKVVFPEEAKFANDTYARKTAQRFDWNLRSVGTTRAVVMGSIHESAAEVALQVFERSGLAIDFGPVMMNQNAPAYYIESTQEAIEKTRRLIDKWNGHDENRLRIRVTPRFAISCTQDLLEQAGTLARDKGVGTHTHINESPGEVAFVRQLFPWAKNYTEVYLKTGIITERDQVSTLAHQIHVGEEELELINGHLVCNAHCPSSNLTLRSKAFDFDFWRLYGGGKRHIGLGSDVGAAPVLSLFDNMRHAHYLNAEAGLDIHQIFWLASAGGARANNFNSGAIEPGREADYIVVDPRPAFSNEAINPVITIHQVLSALMARGHDALPIVLESYVRGRRIYKRPQWMIDALMDRIRWRYPNLFDWLARMY